MTDAEIDALRRKAAKLLEQADGETDSREKARLVNLAAVWHEQAVTAHRIAIVTRKKKPNNGE